MVKLFFLDFFFKLYQFFEQIFINLAYFSKHFNFDRNNDALTKRISEQATLKIPSTVFIIHCTISFPKFPVPEEFYVH